MAINNNWKSLDYIEKNFDKNSRPTLFENVMGFTESMISFLGRLEFRGEDLFNDSALTLNVIP